MQLFEKTSIINASAEQLFDWHNEPDAFVRLVPPWEKVKVLRTEPISDGSETLLQISAGLVKIEWLARHGEIVAGRQFADVQVRGPFAYWYHLHKFDPIDESSSRLTDRIQYELFVSPLTQPIAGGLVRRKLERMFEYRHRVTADAFAQGR